MFPNMCRRYLQAAVICFVCAIPYICAHPSTPVDQVVSIGSLENLLFSLEKLMFFFYKRYDKLNVDGLFGVRAVEGEMHRALEKAEQGIYIKIKESPKIQEKMKMILSLAEKTAELALPYVKQQDEIYFQNFLPVIDKPFRAYEVRPQVIGKVSMDDLPWTRTNRTGKMRQIAFDETESDRCMSVFLDKQDGQKCDLDTCWEVMTQLDGLLYHTTHQILWFQLGIKAGCRSDMEGRLASHGGLDGFLAKLCNNVIFTMETISEGDKVKNTYQDIFLEQGMVCGVMGFMDAVRQQWLTMALRWQSPSLGCFREYEDHIDDILAYEALDDRMFAKKQEWKNRYLLMDVDMGDRCSAHKSAVAAGFLAIYSRLYVDPDYIEYKLLPALYGKGYIPKAGRKQHIRGILIFVSLSAFAAIMLLAIGPRRVYRMRTCFKRCQRTDKSFKL